MEKFEDIYSSSIEFIIDKFISSYDDFFLTEKDLHFYFFHRCLSEDSFEYNGTLLIHTEYPIPLKVKKSKDEKNPIIIAKDDERAMRPHIDSVLFDENFIKWILDSGRSEKEKLNCIRGLGNQLFTEYIKRFRDTYEEFYNEYQESILSHSLEFKFIRGGYEGIAHPVGEIQYDLKKLVLIADKNKRVKYPFSDKATLLVFIGKRGNKKIIEELEKKGRENNDLFSNFGQSDKRSADGERYVIRYDFKK